MESEEAWMDFDWGDLTGDEVRRKTLIGRLVTDRTVNRNVVRNMIYKAWNMQGGLSITEVEDKIYKFAFDREEDCSRIIRGRPWMILGCLLVVEKWKPLLTLKEIELKWSPYWVQLHGLPLEGFSVKNIVRIAGRFGKVLAVEDPFVEGKVTRIFARARVLVDVTKLFLAGVSIPRPGLSKVWVSAKFEKLQQYCFRCGILGHDQKMCKLKDGSPDIVKYEGWIGAEPMRCLGGLILVDGDEDDLAATSQSGSRGARGQKVQDEARGEGSQESVGTGMPKRDGIRLGGSSSGLERTAGKGKEVISSVGNVAMDEQMVDPVGFVTPQSVSSRQMEVVMGLGDSGNSLGPSISPRKFFRARRSPVKLSGGSKKEANIQYIVEIPSDEDKDDSRALVLSQPKKYEADLAKGIQQVCLRRKLDLEYDEQRKKLKSPRVACEVTPDLGSLEASNFGVGKVSPKTKSPNAKKEEG